MQLLGVAQEENVQTGLVLTLHQLSRGGGAAWQAAIDAGVEQVLLQLPPSPSSTALLMLKFKL